MDFASFSFHSRDSSTATTTLVFFCFIHVFQSDENAPNIILRIFSPFLRTFFMIFIREFQWNYQCFLSLSLIFFLFFTLIFERGRSITVLFKFTRQIISQNCSIPFDSQLALSFIILCDPVSVHFHLLLRCVCVLLLTPFLIVLVSLLVHSPMNNHNLTLSSSPATGPNKTGV